VTLGFHVKVHFYTIRVKTGGSIPSGSIYLLTGVGRRVPETMRMDSCNWTSMSLVWEDLAQTGAQYSTVE